MTAPIMIPCRDGSTYTITPEAIEAYRRLYADADGELARMVIKLQGRKAMRPASAASAPRFLRNWFAKARKVSTTPARYDALRAARTDSVTALTGAMDEGRYHD